MMSPSDEKRIVAMVDSFTKTVARNFSRTNIWLCLSGYGNIRAFPLQIKNCYSSEP